MNLRDALIPPREFFIPWRDRRGRFCPVRIPALLALIAPALFFCFDILTEGFGPEPLKETTQFTGLWALRFLLLSLAVTPAGRILGWQRLFQIRRMLGLGALVWVGVHAMMYVVDQDWKIGKVISEVALRFYLTIGFVAVLGLVALAFTSTDPWVRELGRRWKQLHRLVYPIAILAILHAVIQAKSNASEPLVMLGLLLWLAGWRLIAVEHAIKLWVLVALTLAAAAGTAALEYLWYANFTALPAARIFAANFDWYVAPRPALEVALIPAAFLAIAAAQRLALRFRPA
jgi:sulfoxide reductase heme-binding subunit YedZ